MKIFVTGGTGFIGSHFLNRLSGDAHGVIALKRPGSSPRIPLKAQPQWLVKTMPEVTVKDLRGCGTLIHLAAHSANVPYDKLSECLRWNVWEPSVLFENAIAAGVRRFIAAGSSFEYGKSGERYDFIPSSAPLEPTQSYPISKAAASIAFAGFAREKKIEMLILRIFQVFGEGELASRFWPSLRKAALAGEDFPMTAGEQVRDFVPAETVAEKFAAALARSDLRAGEPKIENVGTGKPQTLRSFAEFWWRHWNAKGKLKIGALPYRAKEVMRYVPEIP
ncbi:MAG TPA: NAD(P)-dependent oxidoreductase [Candidatus Aquilonibacter sp.]|nr:NAD(P)-dependent oxidoreductase [Candidatus Aquilonibacter sp.]